MRRPSFPTLHFRPDDVGELFGGGQFSFQFTGQFRLQGVGGDTDGVGGVDFPLQHVDELRRLGGRELGLEFAGSHGTGGRMKGE